MHIHGSSLSVTQLIRACSTAVAGCALFVVLLFFFVASAFRPVWPGRCDLSFICIPQSARALDQGGVEPRQAVSPKALRPWTIPLRYSVGFFCCVVVLVWFLRDFRRNGPVLRFTFSPAQWAPPQLNGPVQHFSDQDS